MKECERRDPKGWYRKAKEGKIKSYTGVTAPYEAPEKPEITLETDKLNITECIDEVINYLTKNKIISL